MIRILPWLLLLAFLAELASIILVGQRLGVVLTLLAIVADAFLGSAVIRMAGAGFADVLRRPDLDSRFASRGAARQFLLLLAGLLLTIPGFASDVVALLLLPRPVRDWLATRLGNWIRAHGIVHTQPGYRRPPLVIEGEVIDRGE